ncbi:AcrR family transcriptional regulator [Cellulomonas hominis]|nr:TetR/AcrR family transcriptional regulator [Cellulomonas hominis]MBB5472604.1 AcrR family transcriptional regulator [Cellulomonas hominis]
MAVADRRRALVDAAVRVIARDGVAGATTRAVVAEAGMSLASLHYAFPSREHLLEAVVAEVTVQERLAAEVGLLPLPEDPAGPAERALEDVIRDGLERYVDLLEADPQREQALLELALYAMRTPGQRASIVAQYDVYRASAAASLTAAALATGSRWTVPLDDAARALVMVTDGLTTAWLADRDTDAARRTARFAARALAALAEPAPAAAAPAAAVPAAVPAPTPEEPPC